MLASRHVCTRCASKLTSLPLPLSSSSASFLRPYSSHTASAIPAARTHKSKGPRNRWRKHHITGKLSEASYVEGQESIDDAALAIFKDVVSPSSPQATESAAVAAWVVAGKLKVMEETALQYGPEERLDAFRAEILPHFDGIKGRVQKHIYLAATTYLSEITQQIIKEDITGCSVRLSDALARIGNWKMLPRAMLVLNLCHRLGCRDDSEPVDRAHLRELIDMWKHLSQLGRASQYNQPLAFTLPSTGELEDRILELLHRPTDKHKDLPISRFQSVQALSMLVMPGSGDTVARLVPALIASTVVFWDHNVVGERVPEEVEPLLKRVATILQRVRLPAEEVRWIFSSPFVKLSSSRLHHMRAYVADQWAQVIRSSLAPDDVWGNTTVRTSSRSGNPYITRVHKGMRAAHKARSLRKLVQLWTDFKAKIAEDPKLMESLREDPEFLDFCMYVWCCYRQNEWMQELVEMMNQIDVQPTVKTYTAMMHGWKTAKDLPKIDALWGQLLDSNIKLDSFIWAERVSAYIEVGKPQRAIEALGEMMSMWRAAVAREDPDSAVKPTIEVINATLKELIRLDSKAAQEVLSWAVSEGIHPDIVTFNILLRPAFRNDDPNSVATLMRSMKEQGVDPDAASFTIILEELLGSMHASSSREQVHAVQQLLSDMTSAGLPPNQQTYAKMLHALSSLRDGGSNEAVQAVKDHARRNSLPITPQMITILIERALCRDNPSVKDMEDILAEHNLRTPGLGGDRTLWERVMSGYAITGQLDSAMELFNTLNRKGAPVTSLACLADLLDQLLAAGLKEKARLVVTSTLRNKMAGQEDLVGDERYWRHRFWGKAQAMGYLRGLPRPPELDRTG